MTNHTDLEIPEDPWMSHAFITKLMTQVSMPYRRPKTREVIRHNGNLTVRFTATGEGLPYGKYPRLFEMWACTMVKTGDASFDPATNTLNLGTTFREFLRLINIEVGGRQLKSIKTQLENLFKCVYVIDNGTETTTNYHGFMVAADAKIDWLRNEPQEHSLFENTVKLSQEYVDYLRDSPVPIDLEIVSRLNSPMSLDIYWWLTRRYSYLHNRQSITWEQIYSQFGSDSSLKKFKQNFKRAVDEVRFVYPQVRITCGTRYVTIYPALTSVSTKYAQRIEDKSEVKTKQIQVSEADISEVLEGLGTPLVDYIKVRKLIISELKTGKTVPAVVEIVRSYSGEKGEF